MFLVIGEILLDFIGFDHGSNLSINGTLGGAPFNLASNLANLGADVKFAGGVGKDFPGRIILKYLKNYKKLKLIIKKNSNKNTPIAMFIKDQNGDGDFEFLRKNPADCALNFKKLKEEVAKDYKIVHFGSLFLSDKKARINFLDLANSVNKNTLKSFDVNIRNDIFKENENYYSYYLEFIKHMDIVKFTKEEILSLSNKTNLEDALSYFSFLKIIFITLGKNGSMMYYKNKIYTKSVEDVEVVDSVGAGDSFFSGALYKLNSFDIDNLTEDQIYEVLNLGNLCARKTCLCKGATNAYKSLEEVMSIWM